MCKKNMQIKKIKSLHGQMHTEQKRHLQLFQRILWTSVQLRVHLPIFLEYNYEIVRKSKQGRTRQTNNFGRSKNAFQTMQPNKHQDQTI